MIDLITGHQGVSHISAEQVATLQNAEMDNFGSHKVVRMVGGAISYAGLTISVDTGYWRVNGYDMEIKEAESILIDPTAAGLHRIDRVFVEILQDIPSGVQRSELRVVQGEESESTPTAPSTPIEPYLNTDLLLQIEEVCTVTVSDGSMILTDSTLTFDIVTPDDLSAVDAKANQALTDSENAQRMIAPIETTSEASQAYAVGKQLIYNGLLYTVDSAIAQGDTLTPGGNISLSQDVTDQLAELNSALTKNTFGTSKSLFGYTVTTPYIAESDGYVSIETNYNSATSFAKVAITDSDGSPLLSLSAHTTDAHSDCSAIYIKKGMKVYPLVASSDNPTILFTPIV